MVGVGGFLLPGNRVDVLATRQMGNDGNAESKTILEDLRVLAVDQTASTDKTQPVVVRAVTVEVSPAQAEVLVKGMAAGKVQLALRNPLDNHKEPVMAEPVAMAEPVLPHVLAKPVVHHRAPANSGSVIMIRGVEATVEKAM